MDWLALADGLRAWFAARSGIPIDDIMWQGEPQGMSGRPAAWLSLTGIAAAGDTDEVRYVSQGEGKDALVRLTGNRLITVSCRVETDDMSPLGRAHVILERVRDGLSLPSSQDMLGSLGLGLVGTLALVDLGRSYDNRARSVAAMDIRFTRTLDSTDDADESGEGLVETVGTIEQVQTSRAP
jgi:hypothetical protein